VTRFPSAGMWPATASDRLIRITSPTPDCVLYLYLGEIFSVFSLRSVSFRAYSAFYFHSNYVICFYLTEFLETYSKLCRGSIVIIDNRYVLPSCFACWLWRLCRSPLHHIRANLPCAQIPARLRHNQQPAVKAKAAKSPTAT
jgi:hypothetical protein